MPHTPRELVLESSVRRLIGERRGRAAAIGMRELAEACGVNTRLVQRWVKHLIEEHGEPIGSATGRPPGYYLVDEPEEVAAAVAQLQHRLASLAVRIARLRKTSVETVFGQLRIEEGMEEKRDEDRTDSTV